MPIMSITSAERYARSKPVRIFNRKKAVSRVLTQEEIEKLNVLYFDDDSLSRIKKCGCGCTYTALEWSTLRLRYIDYFELDEHGDEEFIECRDCKCGSTIAVDSRLKKY